MVSVAPIEDDADAHDPFAEPWEPPTDEQWTAWLDGMTEAEREDLALPFPVRWLYPPQEDDAPRALNLFAGPGGWCCGLRRILGHRIDMVCLDLNADAVATSNAAGCTAIRVDITTLDPEHPALRWTQIVIGSPPCTDWTRAGKGLGRDEANIEALLELVVEVGEAAGNVPASGEPGSWTSFKDPAPYEWSELRQAVRENMTATTAGLMLEAAIFILGLICAGAPLETVALEQSAALPKRVREALWCELEIQGWARNEWVEIDAADYGSPSHRRRFFHMASLRPVAGTVELDAPLVTLASDAVGLPHDTRVITRGNRRTSGGNAFMMGRQIPGVTSKIRSWDVSGAGGRFSIGQMALLVGMPADYPVAGSRTSVAQQLSDVVSPVAAAAVLGVLLGVDWRPALRRYLTDLYPAVDYDARPVSKQLELFPIRELEGTAA